MFHSDRGSQYTAFSFRQLLAFLNVVQSFSKKCYLFVNACCECFFKYLKKEETTRRTYHSLQYCIYPCLSILKDSTIPKDLLVLLKCYPYRKEKTLLESDLMPLSKKFFQIILSTYLTMVQVRVSELLDLKKENVRLEKQYFNGICSKSENDIR